MAFAYFMSMLMKYQLYVNKFFHDDLLHVWYNDIQKLKKNKGLGGEVFVGEHRIL